MCHIKLEGENGNYMAMRKDQLYELRFELNKSKIPYHRLGKYLLENMPFGDDNIRNHDLISRKDISDKSTNCLGISQNNYWCNGVNTWLYGNNDLMILSHILKSK